MITKEQCLNGVKAVINCKKTSWNVSVNSKQNGLMCFPFAGGYSELNEKELLPNVKITILSKPKRFNACGVQVKFLVEGDDTIMSAWWICFKHKVDLL